MAPHSKRVPSAASCIYPFKCRNVSIVILLFLNLVCFQLGTMTSNDYVEHSRQMGSLLMQHFEEQKNPLILKSKDAIALPSLLVKDENNNRGIYGGKGDKKHLGGFTNIDIHGISPFVWRMMLKDYGIKSIIDVGCGRGISTLWFLLNGMDALCVEGSHDAYEKSVLPSREKNVVEHDFSRGPWWPSKTYDAIWCVEFLEHVGRNFHQNYLPTFRKAAIIFATHSLYGGWHHVEVHDDAWWIRKFELYGFQYMPDLSAQVRKEADLEAWYGPLAVTGEKPNPQNLYTMLVFFNPVVGSLPEHAHLFAEPGCFVNRENGTLTLKDCGSGENANEETPLPEAFKPLPLREAAHQEWEKRIQLAIKGNH